MVALSGKNGTLRMDGREICPVTQWKLIWMCENAAYLANDGGGALQRVAGAEDSSGSFLCQATAAGPCPVARGQQAVAEFHRDRSGTNYYRVPILIDRITIACEIQTGDVVTYAVQFLGNGAVQEFTS